MKTFRRFDATLTGNPYVLVSIYHSSHGPRAAISKSEDLADGGYSWPDPGCDAKAALNWAANYAGINAIDVYVQINGVEWDPNWGNLTD